MEQSDRAGQSKEEAIADLAVEITDALTYLYQDAVHIDTLVNPAKGEMAILLTEGEDRKAYHIKNVAEFDATLRQQFTEVREHNPEYEDVYYLLATVVEKVLNDHYQVIKEPRTVQ